MRLDLIVHILAGVLGILSGFFALSAAKGAMVHRKSGKVFVYAMITMAFSFVVGQAKVIPKPIRIYALLVIPPLIVLAALIYWLWRVRWRRSLRVMVVVGAPEAA
jgi:uncharacterized membrane protein